MWLTIGATNSVLPVELFEIIREPRAGRIAVLLVNVAVVVYLWNKRHELASE